MQNYPACKELITLCGDIHSFSYVISDTSMLEISDRKKNWSKNDCEIGNKMSVKLN